MTLIGAAVALMILMAASTRTDVYADYAMPILPLIFISAAGLIAMGVELLRKRVALVTTCAVLIMVAGVLPHVASHLSSGTRFDYRPAFDRVRQAGPQQTMVIWPQIIALHYAPDLKSAPLRMRVEVLDSILTKDQDIWVVGSARRFGLVVDEGGKITRWLHRHCVLDSSFEKPRWDYRLYRVELYRCSTTARNDATAARSTKNYALQLARNLSKR
jgi:hypothetical protein